MHGLQWDYPLIPATTWEQICIFTVKYAVLFLKKIHSGMHSDPKFGQRGQGYIDVRKKVLEHCSGLCPSEKELT
jgi:hypothetical protein